MNIALITAKGGNTSIPNKNLIEINDKPLVKYVIDIASLSQKIDHIFVTTECPMISKVAKASGAHVIVRPPFLSQPDSNHGEVIIHGVQKAQEILSENISMVTILLGNSALLRPEDIDKTIEALELDPSADSAMTVWKAQDDHPYRAMAVNNMGYLSSFGTHKTINTNRQSYPDVFFYDQGPWTVRMETLQTAREKQNGPACWWWMGEHSIPIERTWVTGKDIHTYFDVAITKAWLDHELWKIK